MTNQSRGDLESFVGRDPVTGKFIKVPGSPLNKMREVLREVLPWLLLLPFSFLFYQGLCYWGGNGFAMILGLASIVGAVVVLILSLRGSLPLFKSFMWFCCLGVNMLLLGLWGKIICGE